MKVAGDYTQCCPNKLSVEQSRVFADSTDDLFGIDPAFCDKPFKPGGKTNAVAFP